MSTLKKLKYMLAYVNNIHTVHANVHFDLTQIKILLRNAIKKEVRYRKSHRRVAYGASTGIIKNGY